jgi:hypothetical protein
LDKVEVIEDHQDLPTIFTFLRTGESRDISIMRVLNKHLNANANANAVVESAVVAAWHDMASDTLGYLGYFQDLWELLGPLPKELCECVSISEMTVIVFRIYSIESSLYKNANFFHRMVNTDSGGSAAQGTAPADFFQAYPVAKRERVWFVGTSIFDMT